MHLTHVVAGGGDWCETTSVFVVKVDDLLKCKAVNKLFYLTFVGWGN